MPRSARHVSPGTSLHIVQRGISRHPCFFEERDYLRYLDLLAKCSRQFACAVHAFCLMTNHIHLLVTPANAESCAKFMKHLGQCYVQAINARMQRSGTLWEGRYYSCLLNSERYVLACLRYIELNPVRARMVQTPDEYPWSSYAAHGLGAAPVFLKLHPAYDCLAETPEGRAAISRTMCIDTSVGGEVAEIRKATRLGCVAGTIRRGRGRPPTPR